MKKTLCLLTVALLLPAASVLPADQPPRPNVILIFIDDLGYGDVGFNGATGPKTPNLDRLAAEGTIFRDFYVGCAVCSGSRTALLTGMQYQRLNVAPVLFPNSNAGLHPDEVTLADMLKEAGYRTSCIGKWHLGHLPPCLPQNQGFDEYYGIPYSNDMWRDPANKLAEDLVVREGLSLEDVKAGHKGRNQVPLMRGDEIIEYPADQSTLTQRYTREAIRFLQANRDRPFFIYLPHTMVHVPLAVSQAFENRTGTLLWDAIEELDASLGQLVQAVDDAGLGEKTLIIFTSDNGAAVGSSAPLRAKKGSVYDGGIREPTFMRWKGTIPAGRQCTEVATSLDILPTLAQLCGGKLPAHPTDGKNIWPLMRGEEGAKSPHDIWVVLHGPGAVRSGKWKFYPWPENAQQPARKKTAKAQAPPGPPVQLYDLSSDIGETRNLAETHPEVAARLENAYRDYVAEVKANNRPNAPLERPADALSAERPDAKPKTAAPPAR